MKFFLKYLFIVFGWKVKGKLPLITKKGVFAVAPHATWIDFMIGITVRSYLDLNIGYIGKEELFKPPFGFIFRLLGGTPAIRDKNCNMVENYIKTIKNADDMLFAMAPEGTRKNVGKLRTGFYYMALGANIPIIMVGFDFAIKTVVFAEPFFASGDFEKDMKTYFVPFFEKIGGVKKDWINNYKNNIFQ